MRFLFCLYLQVHAGFLAADDMCGNLEHSSDSGFGENLFMCSSGDMASECYTPAYAMENLCECSESPKNDFRIDSKCFIPRTHNRFPLHHDLDL